MKLWLNRLWMTMAVTLPLCAQVPTVFIDTPTPGATISGTVTVSGWALDTGSAGTAIASVVIQVDGTTVGGANMGISRPDVCQVNPSMPGCPNVGWAYSLNTASLSPGPHSITAIATDSNLPPDTGSATQQVTVGPPPKVFIDSPTPGAVVSGTINVTGWALAAITPGMAPPISSVQVQVDGVLAGNATYGIARLDVCNLYPGGVNCPNVGYTFPLDTSAYSPGVHAITVTAVDSAATQSATTNITVVATPSVFIDTPTQGAVVSGVVTVSGWAIDNTMPTGTGIGSVQILIDGSVIGTANYGVYRADVCGAYPGRPGCPNVGFTYQLNTAALNPGSHTLTAMAADTDANAEFGTLDDQYHGGGLDFSDDRVSHGGSLRLRKLRHGIGLGS